jgi:hypothetical protein
LELFGYEDTKNIDSARRSVAYDKVNKILGT